MPLLVTALDDDALRVVARYVWASRHTYWFCAVCRAFRDAMRSASTQARVKPITSISTAYVSLESITHAASVHRPAKSIVGNPEAIGYNSLLLSRCGRYRWTPSALTLAYAVAPLEVIDYMTPGWRNNCNSSTLYYASAGGRQAVLTELSTVNLELASKLNVYASGNWQTHFQYMHSFVLVPSIKNGQPNTLKWLFTQLNERDTELAGDWRESIGNVCTRSIGTLAVTMLQLAVESPYAARMLGFLCSTLLPRAMKATGLACVSLTASLHATVLALLSGNGKANVSAWIWIKQQTQSAFHVWCSLGDDRNFKVPRRFDSRRVLNSILDCDSSEVYQWQANEIADENGWLYEIFRSDLYGLPRVRPMDWAAVANIENPRAAFALATYMQLGAASNYENAFSAALVDCLIYSHAFPINESNLVNPLRLMPHRKVARIADALSEFFARAMEIDVEHREYTVRMVRERLLPELTTILIEHQDSERAALCLRSYSNGGLGACGAAMTVEEKRQITDHGERLVTGFPLLQLLRDAGMYARAHDSPLDKAM